MRHMSLLFAATVLAVAVWTPTAASAHASLESSTPTQGARLQTMPAEVSLTLTEPVRTASSVEVTAPDGTRVNSDTVTVLDDTVTSIIDRPTPAGTYRMTYRVVSADEHTVSGTIDFEVATATTPGVTAPAPAPATTAPTTGTLTPTQVVPTADDSTTAKDALTIVGFSIVAMSGLVLLIRAGLRSAGAEDDD